MDCERTKKMMSAEGCGCKAAVANMAICCAKVDAAATCKPAANRKPAPGCCDTAPAGDVENEKAAPCCVTAGTEGAEAGLSRPCCQAHPSSAFDRSAGAGR